VSLFSPYAEDFSADFTSDSAGSPVSPVSPVLSSSSFVVPTSDDFGSWDNIDHSPEPDNFFKGPLPQFPVRTMTPAVNPMDLTIQPPVAGYPRDFRGLSSQTPLFQPVLPEAVPAAVVPTRAQQQQASTATVGQASPPTRTAAKRNSTAGLKRKSSTSASEQDQVSLKRSSTGSPSPPAEDSPVPHKKTAHNMIEKRYRTNLNDKITQLREAIPSLRSGAPRFGNYEDEDGYDDDFTSLVPVPKLNKATILSKATEYIMQLEARNRNLETENNAIRGRMEGLEMLMMSRGGAANTAGWS